MSRQASMTAIRHAELARLAVTFHVGMALALALIWVQQAMREGFWRADFSSYYLGGVMLREGQGVRLYDRDLQKTYQARLVPERGETDGLLSFTNPPHAALPLFLFALLPRNAAFYVWDFLQLLLLIPLFCFLRRLTADWERLPFAVLATAVLAFPPLFISFQLGQVSLLVLVCLLGFVCNLAAGRPFAIALWLTLGTVKPQMMLAPAAILLAGRRWRELGLAALLLAAWGLAATVFLGPSCWLDFVNLIQHNARQFGTDGIHPLAMYNFKGFLTSLLGEDSAPWINGLTAAALVLALLAILALAAKLDRPGTAEWDWRLALALQLGLLANPHLNPSDAAAFLVPALLFYRGLRRSGQSAHVLGCVLVCAPALFALDCYGIAVARPAAVHLFFVFMAGLAAAMMLRQAAQNCKRSCPSRSTVSRINASSSASF